MLLFYISYSLYTSVNMTNKGGMTQSVKILYISKLQKVIACLKYTKFKKQGIRNTHETIRIVIGTPKIKSEEMPSE